MGRQQRRHTFTNGHKPNLGVQAQSFTKARVRWSLDGGERDSNRVKEPIDYEWWKWYIYYLSECFLG